MAEAVVFRIPSLAYMTKALTADDEALALEIVMMAGHGLCDNEARHHAGRLPVARPGRLLHRRHGTAQGEEALRGPPVGGGRGDARLPALLRLQHLRHSIPITDVVEWMGHKSIEETYRTYWHLMPGMIIKVARILGAGLWEAA